MLAWSLLALCAVGVVSGTTATTATTKNRDRRSTFLDIVRATSAELIQSFRQETPEAPELPAVIPRGRRFPDRRPPTAPDAPLEATIFVPSPPRPEFGRSLRLRIDLTVPRSDYTEVYDIDWHAESNTACTKVEDGATIIFRVPLLDGRVQFLKVQEDRLNGSAVRHCTISPLLPATPADKTFPGLPDLSLFNFEGYTAAEGWSPVERWSHWVIGKPGEGGAARGESLNFSHVFFMYRDGGHAMPLKLYLPSTKVTAEAIKP